MRTLIYNPSARVGGALSILKDVYKDIIDSEDQNEYIFIVGDIDFAQTKNITVHKFPWVQKGWFHRVYFDIFVANRLVKRYKVDQIISYQNTIIPFVKIPQILYLQQSLPFISKRFTLKESKLLWLYQNIICKFVLRSVKKASKIIVQTQWMKKACAEKCNVSTDIIEVHSPKINLDSTYQYTYKENELKTFFYPASGLLYKNHQVIVDACLKLSMQNTKDYRIIFTLTGDENSHILKLKEICKAKQLKIEFVGKLEREEVYEMYCKSVLVFPSYVETFGLPLLEAKLTGTPIFASNSLFSHEILNDYKDVSYFEVFDSDKLACLMSMYINGEMKKI